jgi:hypothetical protein
MPGGCIGRGLGLRKVCFRFYISSMRLCFNHSIHVCDDAVRSTARPQFPNATFKYIELTGIRTLSNSSLPTFTALLPRSSDSSSSDSSSSNSSSNKTTSTGIVIAIIAVVTICLALWIRRCRYGRVRKPRPLAIPDHIANPSPQPTARPAASTRPTATAGPVSADTGARAGGRLSRPPPMQVPERWDAGGGAGGYQGRGSYEPPSPAPISAYGSQYPLVDHYNQHHQQQPHSPYPPSPALAPQVPASPNRAYFPPSPHSAYMQTPIPPSPNHLSPQQQLHGQYLPPSPHSPHFQQPVGEFGQQQQHAAPLAQDSKPNRSLAMPVPEIPAFPPTPLSSSSQLPYGTSSSSSSSQHSPQPSMHSNNYNYNSALTGSMHRSSTYAYSNSTSPSSRHRDSQYSSQPQLSRQPSDRSMRTNTSFYSPTTGGHESQYHYRGAAPVPPTPAIANLGEGDDAYGGEDPFRTPTASVRASTRRGEPSGAPAAGLEGGEEPPPAYTETAT